MIRRGAIQERTGESTETTASTTPVNLPQHHLPLQKTNPVDENDQLSMKISSNRCPNRETYTLRLCTRPILLMKTTALIACVLSVSALFSSMTFLPAEESAQRQLSAEFMASLSLSRTESTQNQQYSQHMRNNNSFRHPRVLQIDPQFYKVQDNTIYDEGHHEASKREIHVPKRHQRAKRNLENSMRYENWQRDPLREGDCEPMKPWQETSFPSCNKIHETDILSQYQVLTDGGYNTVFKMTDIDGSVHIVKILKYYKDYTDRNLDRVRRDSLIMERATGSDYVVNTYSYCGFSQIVEYGRGGDLFSWIFGAYDHLLQNQKLQIATQVAQALADVHNLEGNGISSMTHGDFASKQYILVDGIFKLSDFNRGRFLRWNNKIQKPCPYTIERNDGKFRSPEEYKYIPQTAAIDVWALGSIFIELVTGMEAWDAYEEEDAQKAIVRGKLPSFQKRIKNLSDPITQVLVKAIAMCYVYDPKDRPKAGVVADYLKRESRRLEIEWNQPLFMRK